MKGNFELFELEDLTLEYCRIRGLIVDRNISRRSEKRIDLYIENGSDKGIGVVIKDWKRAVGVDIVIRAEQIVKTSRFISKILIVSNFFSDPARSLAEKIGIFLLTRSDLVRILSSDFKKKTVKDTSDRRENVVLY
ncbi:MAG: restriction endonuclease [Candidatus Hodarchaeota archaeon]